VVLAQLAKKIARAKNRATDFRNEDFMINSGFSYAILRPNVKTTRRGREILGRKKVLGGRFDFGRKVKTIDSQFYIIKKLT
jgi:hypothetical protein